MYVHRRSRTAQEAATAAKGRATEALRVITEHVASRDFTGHAGDMDAIARRLEAIAKAIRNGEVTASHLAAVLAELGDAPIRVSVAPSGIYVHAPADFPPPQDAVCHRDYEVAEADTVYGTPVPRAGYPTESWRWSRQAGDGVVHIWTAARRCGPLERWRV